MFDQLIQFWQDLPTESREKLLVVAVSTFVGGLTVFIVQQIMWPLVKESGKKFLKWLYPRLVGRTFSWWGVRRYQSSLRKEVGKITNPWLLEIVNSHHQFTEFYVPIELERHAFIRPLSSLRKKVIKSNHQQIPAQEIFKGEYNRIVVVGSPGSGKSTTIRSLAIDCLHGRLVFRRKRNTFWQRLTIPVWQTSRVLPVVLELKNFGNSDKLPFDYIVEQFEKNNFPNAASFIKHKLKRGELLLLFDGLDEVGEDNRLAVIQQLRDFLSRKKYIDNPAVVTCRTAVYRRELDQVMGATFEVTAFTTRQVNRFLQNWSPYYPEGKGHKNLMGILMGIDYDEAEQNAKKKKPTLLQLASTPLNLIIILYFYINDIPLPESRIQFYQECSDAFLQKWHKHRVVKVSKHSAPVKRRVLQNIALYNHSQSKEDCTEDEAIDRVREVLDRMGRKLELAEEILLDTTQTSGLLINTGLNYYFPHLTFQEYFAARELNRLRYLDYLTDKLSCYADNWREVLLFYCALTDVSSRNKALNKLLEAGYIELAALVVAENSEEVNIDLAESILHALKNSVREQETNPSDSLIEALVYLGSNEDIVYSESIFDFVEDLLQKGDSQTRQKILKILAKVSSHRSAKILVQALADDETRSIALNALSTLGEVAIIVLEQGLQSRDIYTVRSCISAWLDMGNPHLTMRLFDKLTHATDIDIRIDIALSLGECFMQWGLGEEQEYLIHKEVVEQLQGERFLGDWIWPSRVTPNKETLMIFSVLINTLVIGIQEDSQRYRWEDYKLLNSFVLIPVALEANKRNKKNQRNNDASKKFVSFLETLSFGKIIIAQPSKFQESWSNLLEHLDVEKRSDAIKLNINIRPVGIVMLYILYTIPLLVAIFKQTAVTVIIGNSINFDAVILLPAATLLLYVVYFTIFGIGSRSDHNTDKSSWHDNSALLIFSPIIFVTNLLSLYLIEATVLLFLSVLVWLPIYTFAAQLSTSYIQFFVISGLFSFFVLIAEILSGMRTTIPITVPSLSAILGKQHNHWISWLANHHKELDELRECKKLINTASH